MKIKYISCEAVIIGCSTLVCKYYDICSVPSEESNIFDCKYYSGVCTKKGHKYFYFPKIKRYICFI